VIPDCLLAAQAELFVGEIGVALDEPAEIVLDRTLVL
jgi:hypothetical protein